MRDQPTIRPVASGSKDGFFKGTTVRPEAAAEVAKALGLNRKTLYRRALDLQGR